MHRFQNCFRFWSTTFCYGVTFYACHTRTRIKRNSVTKSRRSKTKTVLKLVYFLKILELSNSHLVNIQFSSQMPYYGQKLAIKLKFYGKLVRMAKKCYHFLNVLFSPQILSHHKAKSVGESLRKYLIAALGGDPKVHSAPVGWDCWSRCALLWQHGAIIASYGSM